VFLGKDYICVIPARHNAMSHTGGLAVPDYAKAAKIIATLAPVLIEVARQYNESRSRPQQPPDDTGAADGAPVPGDGRGRQVPPPGPTRRPTDDIIDRIRVR
jgi:hypothetical protein